MNGSTTKSGVVKRSGCILVYGSTTKSGVVKRSGCILVYGSYVRFVMYVRTYVCTYCVGNMACC